MVDIGTASETIQEFLLDYLASSGASGYVLGVSGGIDSAVTLQLAVNAVGRENVTAVIVPDGPVREEDIEDARSLCNRLDVPTSEIGVEAVVDALTDTVPFEPDRVTRGNARVRARMVVLYMVANHHDLLVLGTGNRSEILLGYFTKYGDAAADVRPLADLYKTEVRELARHLDLPEKFIEKDPTAGMWAGQTDEDEIGASYDTIDQVLQRLVDEEADVETIVADTGVERETVERIARMYEESEHKRGPVPAPGLR